MATLLTRDEQKRAAAVGEEQNVPDSQPLLREAFAALKLAPVTPDPTRNREEDEVVSTASTESVLLSLVSSESDSDLSNSVASQPSIGDLLEEVAEKASAVLEKKLYAKYEAVEVNKKLARARQHYSDWANHKWGPATTCLVKSHRL